MGNAAQHPTKHPVTHHSTFVESLQHQSHEKDDNTASIEPQPENPTVLDSSEFSTTEHGSSASNTADVGRLEDFVMVGTFFTDESIGLSPPATPDQRILNDVGKEQEIHQNIPPTMETTSSTEMKFEAGRLLFESNEADKSEPTNTEEGEETLDFDSPLEDLLNSDDRTELSDAVAIGEDVSPQHQLDEETIAASDEKQGHTSEADMDPSDDPQKPSAKNSVVTYAIGDHVYQWCSLAGIPGVFQHHGIVIGVQPAGDETYLTIVDFSNVLPSTSGSNNNGKAVHENDPETNPTADSNEIQEANEASMNSDEEDLEKFHRASSVTSVATQESEGTDTSLGESRDFANPKSASAEVEPSLQNKRKRRPFFVSSPSSTSSAPMFSSLNPGAGRNPPGQPARQRNQRQTFFRSTTDSSSSSAEHMLSSSFPDSVRTYTISSRKWHKVVYQANLWQRHFWRSGTCTSVSSDPPGLVMARVFFLMEHRHLVPKYHILQSNCECMAVWCKTGQWSTLQAMSLLSVAAASQVKQATTMAAIAASQQVTVPASGFMGMLGYTTQVSLVSTQPYLLPAIGIYGALTVAVPMLLLNQAQRAWKRTTDVLTQEFWNHAVKEPETFAECITYWSSRGSSEDDDSGRGAVELAVS